MGFIQGRCLLLRDIQGCFIKPSGVTSGIVEVITAQPASLLSGIVQGDEACADSFATLEEDAK